MKKALFLLFLILISNVSATCEKIYEKKDKPDFYIFLDDSIDKEDQFKEAYRINNYLRHYDPFKVYKFSYYYEEKIGDCAYLIDCDSLGIKVTYLDMNKQGIATAKKVIKTNYQLLYINPRYKSRHLFLHEFAHAIGNLKDLDRIKDKRDKDSKTLMHYGSWSYHLANWQMEDIKENIIESKRWCRINKNS